MLKNHYFQQYTEKHILLIKKKIIILFSRDLPIIIVTRRLFAFLLSLIPRHLFFSSSTFINNRKMSTDSDSDSDSDNIKSRMAKKKHKKEKKESKTKPSHDSKKVKEKKRTKSGDSSDADDIKMKKLKSSKKAKDKKPKEKLKKPKKHSNKDKSSSRKRKRDNSDSDSDSDDESDSKSRGGRNKKAKHRPKDDAVATTKTSETSPTSAPSKEVSKTTLKDDAASTSSSTSTSTAATVIASDSTATGAPTIANTSAVTSAASATTTSTSSIVVGIPAAQAVETVTIAMDKSEIKDIDMTTHVPSVSKTGVAMQVKPVNDVSVSSLEQKPVLPFSISVRRPGGNNTMATEAVARQSEVKVSVDKQEARGQHADHTRESSTSSHKEDYIACGPTVSIRSIGEKKHPEHALTAVTPLSQGSEGQHAVPLPELVALASPIDSLWEMGLHVTEKEEVQNLIVDNQFMTDDARRRYKEDLKGHAPFPMAVSLTNSPEHRAWLASDDCRCKWKTDGERRYLILSSTRPYWILVPRSWEYMSRIKETAYNEALVKVKAGLWIIDVELIKGVCSNGADLLVCHDVLMGNGNSLEDQPFDNRYKWLEWFRDAVLKKTASVPKRMCIVIGKFVNGKEIEQITKCLEQVEPSNKMGKTRMQIVAETKMYYRPNVTTDPELFAACGDKRLLCDGMFFQDGQALFNARDERVRQAKWKLINDVELQLRIENDKYVMYDVTPSRMNRNREVSVSTTITKDFVSPGIQMHAFYSISMSLFLYFIVSLFVCMYACLAICLSVVCCLCICFILSNATGNCQCSSISS